jgi:hypothetical protein
MHPHFKAVWEPARSLDDCVGNLWRGALNASRFWTACLGPGFELRLLLSAAEARDVNRRDGDRFPSRLR